MDYENIYITVFAIIMMVFYLNKRINNRKAKSLLADLESEFTKQIKINGKVRFSKLHQLLDVSLKILYTENDIIISGFDYYRNRRTTFIFHNNQDSNALDKLSIPKYVISNVKILEDEKIIIESGEKIKIILTYKVYGQEKLQLKEPVFDELIKKLNKQYNQH